MSNINPATGGNLAAVIESPTIRKIIYGVYALVALAAASTTVGFAASDAALIPEWLSITNAVVAFLGAPIGGLAIANAPRSS